MMYQLRYFQKFLHGGFTDISFFFFFSLFHRKYLIYDQPIVRSYKKKSETPDLENNVFKEYFFRTE